MKSPLFRLPLDDASIPWISTRHPGISWLSLEPDEASAKTRDSVVLIRMSPGRGYPPHRHLGVEHVLILQGGYVDELGEHRAGAVLRYAAGSAHSPVAIGDPELPEGGQNRACILLAIARGGIEELPE